MCVNNNQRNIPMAFHSQCRGLFLLLGRN
eukprot:COSAG04_NODE_17517_length_467_cov_0.804348_2_plen_28_part_01